LTELGDAIDAMNIDLIALVIVIVLLVWLAVISGDGSPL